VSEWFAYTAAKTTPIKIAPNVFLRSTCSERSGVEEAIVGSQTVLRKE